MEERINEFRIDNAGNIYRYDKAQKTYVFYGATGGYTKAELSKMRKASLYYSDLWGYTDEKLSVLEKRELGA